MAQGDVGIYASQISGHLWAPNGAYDALATVTVPAGGVASVTFAGIPQGYKHLQIRTLTRCTAAGNASVNYVGTGRVRFNGDTSSSYNSHWLDGNGSSASGGNFGTDTSIDIGDFGGVFAASPANYFAATNIDILDYTSTTKNKTVKALGGNDRNGYGRIQLTSGVWFATPQAITSITLTTDGTAWAEYSQFALYGVK